MAEVGLNQTSLAEKLGVKPNTISQWLSGTNSPKLETLKKVARATGKNINYFFDSSTNVKGDSKSNGGANINALKNTLENKKNTLFQLREIVKNLQIQLQKSTQYKSELEKRIEDLSYQLQLNQNI